MKKEQKSPGFLQWAVLILVVYIFVANLRYRVTHSDMTETQLSFHIVEMLTWGK